MLDSGHEIRWQSGHKIAPGLSESAFKTIQVLFPWDELGIKVLHSKSLFSEAAYKEMDVGLVKGRSNHSSKNTKVH